MESELSNFQGKLKPLWANLLAFDIASPWRLNLSTLLASDPLAPTGASGEPGALPRRPFFPQKDALLKGLVLHSQYQ